MIPSIQTGIPGLFQEIQSDFTSGFNQIWADAKELCTNVQQILAPQVNKFHADYLSPAVNWSVNNTQHAIRWLQSLPEKSEALAKNACGFMAESAVNAKVYIESETGRSISELAADISAAASQAFKVTATALLLLSNSSIFGLGVLFSFAFPEQMEGVNNRIVNIWGKLDVIQKTVVVATGLIAWPFALAVSAFLTGAHIGCELQKLQVDQPGNQLPAPIEGEIPEAAIPAAAALDNLAPVSHNNT